MMILPSSVVHGKGTEPRVRMSWDTMVAHDKAETYIRAVKMAVKQGYQELFSQVHHEQQINVNQAHGTSGECYKPLATDSDTDGTRVYLVASSLHARV